ncbi:dTDP-4-dehydrorhamnose reductase [Zunongwangia atlantica]|uniref:dTDP-4-dehydrorhamnose reductase n=1 Tax=Zunongwangia atlantica 22II14-10F7 TaxID=1185767 RepID=A0A1Y1T5P5_9FLAO|nr:dTDP-4-dehydrorhamnose reductase [Zunongwangia atlantica]ORL46371.1 dTDP-4-dehydrorhamnose reductase [Zunongwangia atlantica 22II14-10F7]
MLKILVTGGKGQLAQCIEKLSSSYQFELVFRSSSELDITNAKKIEQELSNYNYDYCINCAAYTQVDKAESDAKKADIINHVAVENLAKSCAKSQVKLIHISTDFVFSGDNSIPYLEDDKTLALGVYGQTKLEGESKIIQNLDQFFIIRTSWLYSEFGNNFLKSMLKYGKEREELSVVFDQVGTPTYAMDLAEVILGIIQSQSKDYGVYHYSNEGVASWYDFAFNIFNLAGVNCKLKPIRSKDYPTPAKRPSFSVLDKSKIKSTFQIEIPNWQDSLSKAIQNIN